MSALAVEAPARAGAGRLIVRAAGRTELHLAVATAKPPAAAMFTVALECHPDPETAPGVRPWRGPLDENRLCRACWRSPRTGPQTAADMPEPQSRPAPAAIGRGLWPSL